MAILATETWTGTSGGWPAQWTTGSTGGTATLDANRGRLSGNAAGGETKAYLLGMTSARDLDVTLDIQPTAGSVRVTVALRAPDSAAGTIPSTCYYFQLPADGGWRLLRRLSGTGTYVAGSAAGTPLPGVPTHAALRRVRFQVAGNVVRMKVWLTTGTEPATWDLEWTDPSPGALATATGRLWLQNETTDPSFLSWTYFDNLTVSDVAVDGSGTLELSGSGTLALSGSGPAARTLQLGGTGQLELYQSQDKATLGPLDSPYLAVEVHADLNGETFVLDVDELDGDALLGWGEDDERGWSNVVCDVRAASTRRGVTRVAGALTRAEAGDLSVELEDTYRRFDPYADSRDAIGTGLRIRLRAWGISETWTDDGDGGLELVRRRWSEVLATARIDSLQITYSQDGPPLVSINAADTIGALVAYEQEAEPTPGLGRGDRLLQRVTRILEHTGTGQLADDQDHAYATTLAPTTLDGSAWRHIVAAADAELGRVWVDRHDRLVVRGRGSDLLGPLHGTLSDVHGELTAGDVHCCYQDPAVVLDTQQLTNRAQATRRAWEGRTAVITQPPPQTVTETIPGGTLSDIGKAAEAVLTRLSGGGAIFEDLTWRGAPAVVTDHNAELMARLQPYEFTGPSLTARLQQVAEAERQAAQSTTRTRTVIPDPVLTWVDPPQPATERSDDYLSQARNGVHGISATLEVERDSQLRPWTSAVVAADSQPRLRVDSVRPRPDGAVEAWPAACRTDIGDRWAFRLHPAEGPAVERTLGVLGVAHDISPGDWVVTWTTTDAPAADLYEPDGFFLLNVSELDGDDVMAPYTGEEATWEGWDLDGGDAERETTGPGVNAGHALRVTVDPPIDGGGA